MSWGVEIRRAENPKTTIVKIDGPFGENVGGFHGEKTTCQVSFTRIPIKRCPKDLIKAAARLSSPIVAWDGANGLALKA